MSEAGSSPNAEFAERLLRWWDVHGRKDLPWQTRVNPYRVWISEIMLQQTQVTTVIPYYQRFMARFPAIKQLAAAPLDDVLAHWSGLGYYARARNMHRTAQLIMADHNGRFPHQLQTILELPGIGRSTAGAILALAHNQPEAILDGNVKRVLCRHAAIRGWPGRPRVETQLWELARQYLPGQRIADYTQAMMDLGATCCVPRNPLCGQCPLRSDCLALAQDTVQQFPEKKPRKALPQRTTVFIIAVNEKQQILLERRPPSGIWGGLWCFPETSNVAHAQNLCRSRMGLKITSQITLPIVRHTFSHFQLRITPLLLHTEEVGSGVREGEDQRWYSPQQGSTLGLATPVSRILHKVTNRQEQHTL